MLDIKIVMPGNAITKKNSAKVSFFSKDKFGRKTPRPFPIKYYSEAYIEWAKSAMLACYNFKQVAKINGMKFPIDTKINLQCLFFYDTLRVVDLSGLYEGVQDVLCGKSGVGGNFALAKYPETYKIIQDDSVQFVGSHDNSRFIYEPANPRTEVIITDFKFAMRV